jgi:2-oxoglutarate dehydrogenase E1 component
VHLALLANPSHLEAVNPVAVGKARAKMHYTDDNEGQHVRVCVTCTAVVCENNQH